ncbi:MAG TPA: HRDC domain-containing protein [Acidimicrobiales bacterium]|nr:HRDC domain-containing protein [Acidimicrobiales bacterium]
MGAELRSPDHKAADTRWVDTDEGLAALVDELAAADEYAIDTEFHRERSYWARVALVQIAWAGGIALVDPLAVDIAPLAKVFDGDGLAILHAAEQDLEILERTCGTIPRRMFDTQLSAGFIGYSSPSLSVLVERLLSHRLHKGDQLADWTRRPLPETQRVYAAGDVSYLVELRHCITERLAELGRESWAAEECEILRARPRGTFPVEEAWWKIRHSRQLHGTARGVAQCVAGWREGRARETDQPVRFVLPDLAVVSIAQRPPRSRADLEGVRTVDGRHMGGGAAAELLAAIEAGISLPSNKLRLPPVDHAERVVRPAIAIAAAWVAQRASDLDIDPAILGSRHDIVGFLQGKSTGRLSEGWRHDIVGEPLRKLAAGELSLAFDGEGELVLEERSGRRYADGA